MAVTFKSGRAGNITIGAVTVPITKWTFAYNVGLEETTSSSDYDSGSDRTSRSKIDTVDDAEGSIEFNYDAGGTTSSLYAQLLVGPVAVVLKTDSTTTFATFNAFLSKVETTLETVSKISGSASFESTGKVTVS